MLNPWIYRAPAIGWGFLILYICLAPVEDLDPGFSIEISDKLVHFILYFPGWCCFTLPRPVRTIVVYRVRKMLAYWIAAAIIGGAVEYASGRHGIGPQCRRHGWSRQHRGCDERES